MTYHGKVKNGVVVLDSQAHLPEGADVLVEPVAEAEWVKCVGTISDDEADGMLSAIEEMCEKIDPESDK